MRRPWLTSGWWWERWWGRSAGWRQGWWAVWSTTAFHRGCLPPHCHQVMTRQLLHRRLTASESHITSTVSAASGRYRLRSTGSAAYILPRTRTKFGDRGFFYSGPAAWNTLPFDLHDITDTSTFRKRLKNVLFDRAYNWLLLALLDES